MILTSIGAGNAGDPACAAGLPGLVVATLGVAHRFGGIEERGRVVGELQQKFILPLFY
jgi:hypothetical protein